MGMTRMIRWGYGFLAAVVLLGSAVGFVEEVSAAEYTMRFGGYLAGKDPSNLALVRMAALLEKKTNGRAKIDVFTDGKLGNEREVAEGVRVGTVELIATLGLGLGSYVPAVAVVELPFTSVDTEGRVGTKVLLDVMPDVANLSAPKGFRPLTAWSLGARGILTKKPVHKLEDLQGMKIRGPMPVLLGMLKALGANPVQFSWQDMYMALQTGAIDGMEASPQMIYPSKFQEVAKYYSVTRHMDPGYYLLISEKYWQKLPPDIQKAVRESADEAASYIWENGKKIWDENATNMKKEGVEFIDLPDLPKWVNAVEAFNVDFVKTLGPEAPALHEKVKQSVAKWEKYYGIKR